MSDPLSAFGRAEAYDAYAQTQRHVAEALAGRIAALPLPKAPRVLEIGCGTGFLTAALRPRIGGDWTVTDLAPEMLARCRARIGDGPGLCYRLLDGERPDLAPESFDLICSSLAFQWFADLQGALERLMALLAPGGRIAFATMAEESFAEWRAAFVFAGLEPATPLYPSITQLAALSDAAIAEEHIVERHADARAFLTALRGIGAQSPRAGHRPATAAELRRVMAAFEAGGASVTYHVAYVVVDGE
ncbi:methyltransferase domain-containing protein [Flavisphingomonas formosensis]|uniref:methyltransferase domain-containing protein n=1 Tax=Flavisphingomonas formosensis TaxID=861534 RepID=UPI0012FA4680|nr:methyltransferase domain-containing protein [Sphingomonas formosensis]